MSPAKPLNVVLLHFAVFSGGFYLGVLCLSEAGFGRCLTNQVQCSKSLVSYVQLCCSLPLTPADDAVEPVLELAFKVLSSLGE